MNIRPLGAEFHAERRRGVTKLVVLFFTILRTRLKKWFFFKSWDELCSEAHPICHGNDCYSVVCSLWSSYSGPRKNFALF